MFPPPENPKKPDIVVKISKKSNPCRFDGLGFDLFPFSAKIRSF